MVVDKAIPFAVLVLHQNNYNYLIFHFLDEVDTLDDVDTDDDVDTELEVETLTGKYSDY